MFLREQDPVSVHCLAMAGDEIAEHVARAAGGIPFLHEGMATFPEMKIKHIRDIQRKFYNAFKHATTREGEGRQDEEVLNAFEPTVNDHALFCGWYDYMQSGLPIPIEAQVFTAWYFVKYPEKLHP